VLCGRSFVFDNALFDESENKWYMQINSKRVMTITSLVEQIVSIDSENVLLTGPNGELTL
jgi:hypothetical protein